MTGWLKEHRIPLVAKEALMLPLVLRLLRNEIRRLRDDGRDMRILRNGDIYQICRFMPDECGEAIGEVVTDKIVDLQQARTLLAGQRALKLLGKLNETAIQYVLEYDRERVFPVRIWRSWNRRLKTAVCMRSTMTMEEAGHSGCHAGQPRRVVLTEDGGTDRRAGHDTRVFTACPGTCSAARSVCGRRRSDYPSRHIYRWGQRAIARP